MSLKIDKTSILAVAAVASPLLLLQGAPLLKNEAGPATSLGASTAAAPDGAGASKPSAKQLAAARYAHELASKLDQESPFDTKAVVVEEAPARTEEAPTPVEAPRALNRPTVMLKSIIRQSKGGALAFINNKLHKEGDEVADGWTITSIDPDGRSVSVASSDGQEFTVTLNKLGE